MRETLRTPRLIAAATLSALPATVALAGAPAVGSADLIAHFSLDPSTLSLDASNNVLSWTALNDSGITLSAGGTNTPDSITYNAAALGGAGSLVVRDYAGNDRHLRGSLNLASPLTDATIFWLGHYEPGADGSVGDGSGQYAYSLGPAGSQGSQMDHQIDSGAFELYGGSGSQTGNNISALNGTNSVWRTDYFSGSPGHTATVNGTDLGISSDGGYNVSTSSELQLFGWQDNSGTPQGFNFVGGFSEMLIYSGRINESDGTAIQNYLASKLNQPPPTATTFTVNITGNNTAQDNIPDGFAPHGNKGLTGTGTFTFDPTDNTMDWSITLDENDANQFNVTQAHFYNLDRKSNGDSIFCWGGRWSDDAFLSGEGFGISSQVMSEILANPEQWVLVLHTEGGHFAVDEQGQLVEYDANVHEVSETGQAESGDRYNNRVAKKLTDLLLREQNPHSGGFGQSAFDAVYPDTDHFDREHTSPFADADGNQWIEWDDAQGEFVLTSYAESMGLVPADLDKEFLFYRYDDQGPQWDYGGPEGAAAGLLLQVPEPSTLGLLSVAAVSLLRRRR